MVLITGSLQLGLIYGLLAMGVYISFRILNIPDLTAEGSFTFGLAASAALTVVGHPILGLIVGMLAGALAGFITAFLQTKMMVHPVLAGILTMSGLYSINLLIMGESSNLSLIGHDTIFKFAQNIISDKNVAKLLVAFLFALVAFVGMVIFFQMHTGLCIRATGDNEEMVKASSINIHAMKMIAMAVANGLIALSGAVIAQYQGFADINSGVGILVVGLASVIIGEAIFGKRNVIAGFATAIFGSIIYRFIIALAMKTSLFPAYALKLVSAVIVAVALSVPAMKYYGEVQKIKTRQRR